MMDGHYTLKDFRVEDSVEIHPATDEFMRGLQHGTVATVGRKWVTVLFLTMDGQAIHRKMHPQNLIPR